MLPGVASATRERSVPILVFHSGATIGLALMARLLQFSEVTMLSADRAHARLPALGRPGVVVLGPCLRESQREHLVGQLSRLRPPVPWIDLVDAVPRLVCADGEPSPLGSAVELALS